MARKSLPDLLAALRLDSGPPLHYLAAKLLLLPFAVPGPADVAVRLLSVVRVAPPRAAPPPDRAALRRPARGRRRGGALPRLSARGGVGGRGAGLRARFAPGARGVREAPGARGGAAGEDGRARGALRRGGRPDTLPRAPPRRGNAPGGARSGAVPSPRLPRVGSRGGAGGLVASRGARAAASVDGVGRGAASRRAGAAVRREPRTRASRRARTRPAPRTASRSSCSARRSSGGASGRASRRRRLSSPLLALLGPLLLYSRSVLLPDRTALVFLPFVALVLAEARSVVPAAAGPAAAAVLAASLSGLAATDARGAARSDARAAGPRRRPRRGRRPVGTRARLSTGAGRNVRAGDVVPVGGRTPSRLVRGVRGVEAETRGRGRGDRRRRPARGRFFVLSPETRAGRVLVDELASAGGSRVAVAGVFEVWTFAAAGSQGRRPGTDGPP